LEDIISDIGSMDIKSILLAEQGRDTPGTTIVEEKQGFGKIKKKNFTCG